MHTWENIQLHKKTISDIYDVYYTPEINIVDYQKIIDFNSRQINKIKQLNLPQSILPQYSDIFIANHDDFRNATDVPFDWAIACVRQNDFYEKPSCSQIFSAEKYKNYFQKGQQSAKSEYQILHEYFHLVMNNVCNEFYAALEEGLCEAFPRYVMDYNKKMPEYTSLICNFTEKELINAEDLNKNGISYYSDDDPSTSISYISSFLFATGLLLAIEEKHNINKAEALKLLLVTLKNSQDDIYNAIDDLTGYSKVFLSKQLQLKAIKYFQA